MGLIIGENESNTLDFDGKGLTSKTVKAVADSISRYKPKIEHLNFANNQLKDLDCKVIVDSLQNHYKNILSISFKGNKINNAGITALLTVLEKTKALELLDLSENIISDEPAMRLFEKLEKVNSNLKCLMLARNFIGKSVYAQGMVKAFGGYITSSNCNLEVIDMSWNNIGGKIGKSMLQALGNRHTLKSMKFAYNLLGAPSNVKGAVEEPAILELYEVLLKSQSLEEIDISYNSIDSFAIYCVSYGLERTASLKTINLLGNPIGSTGVRYLISAVQENPHKQFTNFIIDTSLSSSSSSGASSYEIPLVEGEYAFDLSKAFDRLRLRKLLDLDLFVSKEVPGISMGQCLLRPRLDNMKPWPLPKNEATWSWNWPIEPLKGILRIGFSLKHLKTALQGLTPTDLLERVKKVGGTEKGTVHEHDFENICKVLMEYRNANKEESQVEMLIGFTLNNKLWMQQANEFLLSLRSMTNMEKVLPYLIGSIMDRLLVHTMFDTLSKDSIDSIVSRGSILTEYTPLNPNAHYSLDLSNPHELYIKECNKIELLLWSWLT